MNYQLAANIGQFPVHSSEDELDDSQISVQVESGESMTADHQEGSVLGMVFERIDQKEIPIVGATLNWLSTNTAAVTDEDGFFSIPKVSGTDQIVVSYIGYQTDTINISRDGYVKIVLSEVSTLEAIQVTHKRQSTEVSFLNPSKVQKINEKELVKAACCNLSESFETNATVDAATSDAITGTRKIKMLGLEGANILMTRELIPVMRGQQALFGLTFIPGQWIQGININTGTASVLNGFGGLTGQIDVTLKQPDQGDKLYVNLYANNMSRMEGNLIARTDLSDKISTALLIHGSTIPMEHDKNDDSFLDASLLNQIGLTNRWFYKSEKGIMGQFGVSYNHRDTKFRSNRL